ncbi:MAG: hypothetical protein WC536_04425 [Patescibacteria group bacterium]
MKKIGLKHIDYLTDDFGIWQHTKGPVIDRKHGYALDDAARGLLLAIKFSDYEKAMTYINFMNEAIGDEAIINFYDSKKRPLGKPWSEDALAEAYWALCTAVVNSFYPVASEQIIQSMITRIKNFKTVRGRAYAILGASQIDFELTNHLAESLSEDYEKNKLDGWQWAEDNLTYANAIIPLSFLCASEALKKPVLKLYGLEMLSFLNKESKHDGYPITIGNRGWYEKTGEKAIIDQQPIDAAYQVLANLKAWELTDNENYLEEAKIYFSWFWGNNILQEPLINIKNESCGDGLNLKRVDPNCGAESTICYLLAQEEIWPYLINYEEEYMKI